MVIMILKIDAKDKRIINELWTDARQSDSRIAKKVGLSREVVSYRINRLEKLGAIKSHICLVDTAILGYSTFHVYVRLKNFDFDKENEIISIIKSNPYVKWLISMSGQYDLFFVMIARSRAEFDKHLTDLYSKFSENVSESMILNSVKLLKDVDFFYQDKANEMKSNENKSKEETIEMQPGETVADLDALDYEILKAISTNARINSVDIVKSVKKITAEAISYRIKKLQEAGIIRGFRVVLDYGKLGFLWYKLLLNLSEMPSQLESKLKEFLRRNKKVIYADKTHGEWNIRLELLVENHDDFHKELINIRKLLASYLNRYELMVIFGDHTMVSFTEGIYGDFKRKLLLP